MKKITLISVLFFGITANYFAQQDVCLYALPAPLDSSNLFPGCQLKPLLSADFNSDGKDDLVADAVYVDPFTHQFSYGCGTLISAGDGTFPGGFGPGSPSPSGGAATTDFNEDGYPDLVTTYASGYLTFSLSNGSGGYTNSTLNLSSYYGNVITGDFDNDGHEDVILGNAFSTYLRFFRGDGTGSFAPVQNLNYLSSSINYAADINTDGLVDIAWSGQALLSNGNGNFTLVNLPGFNSLADVNSDGFIDALTLDSVFLNSGYGTFPVHMPLNLGAGFNTIMAPVDLNNDNDPELVTVKGDGQGMDTVYVFLGSAGATFVQSQFSTPILFESQFHVTSGDFDGNGFRDIIFTRDSGAFEECVSIFYPIMNYTAGIISASSYVCQGDSLQLSVNHPGQISWSTGDTTSSIYVSAAGTYSVTTTTSSGCSGTDAITISQVNATTFSSVTSTNHFCLYSSSFALTSGAPAGGTYSGPGVSGTTFNPQAAGLGTHTLFYTYAGPGGCNGTDSLQVTVDLCLGMEENSTEGILPVYPNPGSGQFTVSTNETEFTLFVYDVYGNIVQSISNEKAIDISAESKGIYFIRIIAADKIYVQKIILQ